MSARGKCASCSRQGYKLGGKAWGPVKSSSGKAGGKACWGSVKVASGKTGGKACWGPEKSASGKAGGKACWGPDKAASGKAGGQACWGPAKAASGKAGGKVCGILKSASGLKGGMRSGMRRTAKIALVIKRTWLKKIFAGEKDWEIRGRRTLRRGWIHLAESGAGGKLVGIAKLVDCIHIPRLRFLSHTPHHCVKKLSQVAYKKIYAYVLRNVTEYEKEFHYRHRAGAIIWVRV